VRLPVRVRRAEGKQPALENVLIEFGTYREVFFASAMPLQFAETLRVQNADGSFDVDVTIVAMQEHEGQLAVAARFSEEVTNWILKP
jgi:hypothetical protein